MVLKPPAKPPLLEVKAPFATEPFVTLCCDLQLQLNIYIHDTYSYIR